jgi:uncharacterized protein (TIGR02453 family)
MAGYYLHVEPKQSFLAGGIYMPPSPVLKAIRQEIFENYDEFLKIIENKDFVKYFKAIKGDRLKTKPKGFPDDFEGLEYLKFKDYNVIDTKTDAELMDKDFFSKAIVEYKAMFEFNRFLNSAIEPII